MQEICFSNEKSSYFRSALLIVHGWNYIYKFFRVCNNNDR